MRLYLSEKWYRDDSLALAESMMLAHEQTKHLRSCEVLVAFPASKRCFETNHSHKLVDTSNNHPH